MRGEALIAETTRLMVEFHERYYHRKPVTAKTVLLDEELLICVLGGVYTEVEKTMIELQRAPMVQQTRSDFQDVMEPRFVAAIERISGRRVLLFMSDHHVGPDMEVELFVLAPEGAGGPAAEPKDTPGSDPP